jgi:hypothetical protein
MYRVCCLLMLLMLSTHAHAKTGAAFFLEPQAVATEEFRGLLAKVAPKVYMAGQPTEAGIKKLPQMGVTTVINLRTQMEMDNREVVPFDEAAAVEIARKLNFGDIPLEGFLGQALVVTTDAATTETLTINTQESARD